MMLDPVCEMRFDLREAGAMAVLEGRGYYFCSGACRERFETDPERFLGLFVARRLTVGVMGSADDETGEEVMHRARRLGREIAGRAWCW